MLRLYKDPGSGKSILDKIAKRGCLVFEGWKDKCGKMRGEEGDEGSRVKFGERYRSTLF